MQDEGICNYAINSILFLTPVQEKYVRMYERFIEELKLYSRAIIVLSKGYLPHFAATLFQIGKDFEQSKNCYC